MTVPRTGPAVPWIQGSDVKVMPGCAEVPTEICQEAAEVASDILYNRSLQQFTGVTGPVTVRPVARPVDIDTRAFGTMLSPNGYLSSWGSCTAYGMAANGALSHYGCSRPPQIELGGYPVVEITQVLIDGVVIPPDEYALQDYRQLIRIRPSPTFTPTERWGWPTCQIMDLPDTAPGTFAVTYRYGVPPPVSGIAAAKRLAQELALARNGSQNRLPTRIQSVNRQGVSAIVYDLMDSLDKGRIGLFEVDVFLKTYNPDASPQRATVWSPDMGRPARVTY